MKEIIEVVTDRLVQAGVWRTGHLIGQERDWTDRYQQTLTEESHELPLRQKQGIGSNFESELAQVDCFVAPHDVCQNHQKAEPHVDPVSLVSDIVVPLAIWVRSGYS